MPRRLGRSKVNIKSGWDAPIRLQNNGRRILGASLRSAIGVGNMTEENEPSYYAGRAQHQPELAGAATDASIKAILLNLAAQYAMKHELADRGRPAPTGVAMGRASLL